jgi:hypothetical protein
MRTRSNYGVTGSAVTLSALSTGGIFGTEDLRLGKLNYVWPLVITVPPTVEYLVVAGGGGGGMTPLQGLGSGGGAGGFLTASEIAINGSTLYTITVGSGGNQAVYPSQSPTNGSDSSISGSGFTTVTAIGGGSGSTNSSSPTVGSNGGSGGGGGARTNIVGQAGGIGVYPGSSYLSQPRQGYDGGAGNTSNGAGGGGGGAGGAGAPGNTNSNGGVGLTSSISGTLTYYAGGGGGGSSGTGGNGGGGSPTNINGNATENTGGGGGASPAAGTYSGTGGSGIVIIRYADTYAAATSTTGSPTVTVAGGFRVYKFTSSGSITF